MRAAARSCPLGASNSSAPPRCPDPGRALTALPRALWPLASWHAELTESGALAEALATLRWYTDPREANYRRLNRQLRAGAGANGGRLPKEVEALDALIRAGPRLDPPGLTLWRGLADMSYVGHVVVERAPTVLDMAYMSCSLQRSVGNLYARREAVLAEDLEDAILLRIEVPAGAAVLCVACDGQAGVRGEEEVLLPRGSTLHVERVLPRNTSEGPGSIHYAETRLSLTLGAEGPHASLKSQL